MFLIFIIKFPSIWYGRRNSPRKIPTSSSLDPVTILLYRTQGSLQV